MTWRVLVLFAWLAGATPGVAAGQAPPAAGGATNRVRVFLDCSDCFREYLRDEIDWVDFVRQAEDAEVHLLSRTSETDGRGREVVLRFDGRSRFEGHGHDLRAIMHASVTEHVRREVLVRTAIVGLLPRLVRRTRRRLRHGDLHTGYAAGVPDRLEERE